MTSRFYGFLLRAIFATAGGTVAHFYLNAINVTGLIQVPLEVLAGLASITAAETYKQLSPENEE